MVCDLSLLPPLWQLREVPAGSNSYESQNELALYFGLGDAQLADEVVVKWPNGMSVVLHDVPTRQTILVRPPGRAVPAVSQWGLLIAVGVTVTAGTILIRRRLGTCTA